MSCFGEKALLRHHAGVFLLSEHSELTRGRTIITIAHRLATIRNADQILVVEEGRIAEKGTHDELIRENGLYRRFTEIREKAEGWRICRPFAA